MRRHEMKCKLSGVSPCLQLWWHFKIYLKPHTVEVALDLLGKLL